MKLLSVSTSRRRRVYHPQLVAVWNQTKGLNGITATPCMASSRRSFILYALRAMPCATSSGFHTTRGARWFHTKPAAWITKKELLVDKSSFFCWWGMVDSDHRSQWQQIYSLPPLAAREIPHYWSWWTESNHQPPDYKSGALPLSHTSLFVRPRDDFSSINRSSAERAYYSTLL